MQMNSTAKSTENNVKKNANYLKQPENNKQVQKGGSGDN